VLRLIAQGVDRQEIAAQLSITSATARMHIANIRSQLGVRTQAAAVHKAHVLGILSVDDPT
jgi:DNA-binding CsgD family transcriptional regulator